MNPQDSHVEYGTIELSVRTFKEAGRYVARCDQLGISDHGDTESEALKNFSHTIGLFFVSCMKRRTLTQFLADKGISVPQTKSNTTWVPIPILASRHDANPLSR